MTNKPMLSVERELLESCWAALMQKGQVIKALELRALLDQSAPEPVPVAWMRFDDDQKAIFTRSKRSNQSEPLYAHPTAYRHTKPAAQHQGDPDRALKDALFACLAAGGDDREYGGVATAGDRQGWVRFTTAAAGAQHQGEPVAIDERAAYEEWQWRQDWPIEALAGSTRSECFKRRFLDHEKYEAIRFNDGLAVWLARAALPVQPAPVADHTQCEECKGWGYHENHHEGGGTECRECGGSGNATVAVAVAMPDRMKVEPFTTIDRGSKNYKSGYNAAIAEVAKLNGLKP